MLYACNSQPYKKSTINETVIREILIDSSFIRGNLQDSVALELLKLSDKIESRIPDSLQLTISPDLCFTVLELDSITVLFHSGYGNVIGYKGMILDKASYRLTLGDLNLPNDIYYFYITYHNLDRTIKRKTILAK